MVVVVLVVVMVLMLSLECMGVLKRCCQFLDSNNRELKTMQYKNVKHFRINIENEPVDGNAMVNNAGVKQSKKA